MARGLLKVHALAREPVSSLGMHISRRGSHLRNLYEASVTAALFMIITFEVTKIDNHKNDGKMAHFPPPNPLLRRTEAARPRCRQNEKSMKRREKPRAAISCDMMTIMRDGVLEF